MSQITDFYFPSSAGLCPIHARQSEDFWVKAERLLYCALIGYIWYEAVSYTHLDVYKRQFLARMMAGSPFSTRKIR